MPYSSGANKVIVEHAIQGLNNIFRDGYFYKKSGIILNDISNENVIQPDLFIQPDKQKDKLSKVMDEINAKCGKDSIKLAGEGIRKEWNMSRHMLSKRYTSDWNELLKID